jgi:hypothetical protein
MEQPLSTQLRREPNIPMGGESQCSEDNEMSRSLVVVVAGDFRQQRLPIVLMLQLTASRMGTVEFKRHQAVGPL